MNKQELIKKYEMKGEQLKEFPVVAIGDVLKNLRELDEPEKVIIPKFVADWIEEARKTTYNIRGAIEMAPNGRAKDWLELKNVNIFAEAWVNGYAVEKEKRYLVKLKGIFKGCEYLNFKFGRVWTFSNEEENEEYRTCHTKKELEDAGFGWVFDCSGVEVQEVDD